MPSTQTLLPPPVQKPGQHKARRAPMTLSRKVKAAIELMIFGDNGTPPLARKDAAKAVGLADTSLRLAFRNPVVMAHYQEQLDVLRTSARPRAFYEIVELSTKAKAEGVKLKAAEYVDSGGRAGDGLTVNVGVQVQQPGYVLMVDPAKQAAIAERQQTARLTTIEAKALDDNEDVAAK